MKILRVHVPGDEKENPQALLDLFPDAEIDQVSIDQIETARGGYGIVYCENALQTLSPSLVPLTVEMMSCLLSDRGELWIMVPSMEWAADQVLTVNPSPLFHPVVFGSDAHPSRCGFTLAWLRQLVESVGLIPRKANQSIARYHYGETVEEVPNNFVIGWKVLQ